MIICSKRKMYIGIIKNHGKLEIYDRQRGSV